MSLAELVKRFNEVEKSPQFTLYSETVYRRNRYNYYGNKKETVDEYKYTKVMAELIKKDYKFTQKHFDNFVKSACSRKSRSYLLNNVQTDYRNNSPTEDRILCINTMFSQFTPNESQLKLLLGCYDKGYSEEKNKPVWGKNQIIDVVSVTTHF